MYKPQLDGMRMVGFLTVFVAHCYLNRFWEGGFGVQFFFTLSGFLITRILLLSPNDSLGHALKVFYARRSLRVFPIYYLIILVTAVFGQLDFVPSHLTYTFNIHAFVMSARGDVQEILRQWHSCGLHFWSLCVEEQFYLVYPIMLLLVPARRRGVLFVTLLALSISCRFVLGHLYPESWYGALLPVCGEYILWGCVAAWLDIEGRLKRWSPRVAIYGSIAVFLVAILNSEPKIQIGPVFAQFIPLEYQTVFGLCFAALVWGLWNDERTLVTRVLSWKPFVYVGRMSYGLYLIHLTTWSLGVELRENYDYFRGGERDALIYLMLLALTLALGALSWHLFESPINALKRYFPYRRTTSGSQRDGVADAT